MAKKGSIAVSVGLGATILYLGANAVTGAQGLSAYVELQEREAHLRGKLAEARSEVAALQSRADRLRGPKLDRDYLDERARDVLGVAEQGELTFALSDEG